MEPIIGSLKVDELRATDVAEALRPILLSKPETDSRVKQRCEAVMRWAAARGFIVARPVSVVIELCPKQPSPIERVCYQPAVPW